MSAFCDNTIRTPIYHPRRCVTPSNLAKSHPKPEIMIRTKINHSERQGKKQHQKSFPVTISSMQIYIDCCALIVLISISIRKCYKLFLYPVRYKIIVHRKCVRKRVICLSSLSSGESNEMVQQLLLC